MKISNTATIILLGVGAWAIYKYNQMSEEEQTAIKDKGKKIYDEHISPLIANALGLAEDGAAKLQNISLK